MRNTLAPRPWLKTCQSFLRTFDDGNILNSVSCPYDLKFVVTILISITISFNFAAKLRKNRHRIIILLILFEYFNRFLPKIARYFIFRWHYIREKQVELICSAQLFASCFYFCTNDWLFFESFIAYVLYFCKNHLQKMHRYADFEVCKS